jgi:S-adenosylmethionine:diacylglycerol 3-amino-3-carboxypropyl transferase
MRDAHEDTQWCPREFLFCGAKAAELTMNKLDPPFKSDLFYSAQNEDYQTELAVLRRIYHDERLRVLLVASSGENALSLLAHDFVACVDAVDISAAQIHLCELRCAALEHLSRDEQLRLFDALPSLDGSEDTRLALYDRIRAQLPEPSRAFWDARREQDITFGVQHVGRNDVLMYNIVARLQAAGFAPLQRPLRDDELPAWQAVYREVMTPAYILDLFGLPSEGLAARIAGAANHLSACHFRALQNPNAERNPFVTLVFAGAYATAAGEDGLPLYLQMQGQEVLRRLGVRERLRLRVGNMLEQMTVLAQAHGAFDLISLSNIADWMSDAQFTGVVTQAREGLREGGALLARMGTGSRMIVDVMAQQLHLDDAFNAELLRVERGPWFRTIAVGFRAS